MIDLSKLGLKIGPLLSPYSSFFLSLLSNSGILLLSNANTRFKVITACLQPMDHGHGLTILLLGLLKFSFNSLLALSSSIGLCLHLIVVSLELCKSLNCDTLLLLSHTAFPEYPFNLALGVEQFSTPSVLCLGKLPGQRLDLLLQFALLLPLPDRDIANFLL